MSCEHESKDNEGRESHLTRVVRGSEIEVVGCIRADLLQVADGRLVQIE